MVLFLTFFLSFFVFLFFRPSSIGLFFFLALFFFALRMVAFSFGREREKKAEVSGGDSEERGWREYKGPQKRLPAVT